MINTFINKFERQIEEFKLLRQQENKQYSYISLSCPIPSPISLIPASAEHYFYINKPNSGSCLLGLGSLVSFKSTGANRFNSIKNNYSAIVKKWYQKDKNYPPSIQAFMAFAFDENDPMSGKWGSFPNTSLTIPEILIKEKIIEGVKVQTLEANIMLYSYQSIHQTSNEDLYYQQTFNSIKKQFSNYIKLIDQVSLEKKPTFEHSSYTIKDKQSWKALTLEAITKINEGEFEKIVTSHCQSHQVEHPISITQLIENLNTHYPSCTITSYKNEQTTIVAASPERLLSLNHPIIESDAIGGTIQKTTKSHSLFNNEPNSKLNKKLLKEHQFISHDIYHRLNPFCNTLKMPISPTLMMLHNMYHLETLIQGTLKPQYRLFDILEGLHPTPAVAGFPAQKAKQWLLKNELHTRGWYTGAFGWVDSTMNGEISVMLRCALINDKRIDVFAGAGLVTESDPETEWQEINTKIHTILDRL